MKWKLTDRTQFEINVLIIAYIVRHLYAVSSFTLHYI